MSKLVSLRSMIRSVRTYSINNNQHLFSNGLSKYTTTPFSSNLNRFFLSLSTNTSATSPKHGSSDCRSLFAIGIGGIRSFSEDATYHHVGEDVTYHHVITDPEIQRACKSLMAVDWDKLPSKVIRRANKALSKETDDKIGQEILANVFRAAEAAEEFNGILVSLRMEIDDKIGMSGENVKALSDEIMNALRVAYQRYTTYLDAFGPDETYLRKKVESEIGTRMIHLKMRCSGLGSEWGKVTVLGTSGLSGSYVEQRA